MNMENQDHQLLDEILLSLRKIEHGTRKPSRCLKLYIQVILIQHYINPPELT
ncbi:unnamed protein product, partial [Didymodactylos carnosus]